MSTFYENMRDQKVLYLKDTHIYANTAQDDNHPFPIMQPEQQETVRHTPFLIHCLSASHIDSEKMVLAKHD